MGKGAGGGEGFAEDEEEGRDADRVPGVGDGGGMMVRDRSNHIVW